MTYECPKCNQLMASKSLHNYLKYNCCNECELVYDHHEYALFTFDNWAYQKIPIISGSFKYCRRIYKMKAFL